MDATMVVREYYNSGPKGKKAKPCSLSFSYMHYTHTNHWIAHNRHTHTKSFSISLENFISESRSKNCVGVVFRSYCNFSKMLLLPDFSIHPFSLFLSNSAPPTILWCIFDCWLRSTNFKALLCCTNIQSAFVLLPYKLQNVARRQNKFHPGACTFL